MRNIAMFPVQAVKAFLVPKPSQEEAVMASYGLLIIMSLILIIGALLPF